MLCSFGHISKHCTLLHQVQNGSNPEKCKSAARGLIHFCVQGHTSALPQQCLGSVCPLCFPAVSNPCKCIQTQRNSDLLVGSHDTFLINGKMLPDEIPGLQTQANISNTRNFQTLQATTSVVTAVFALPAYQTNSFTQPGTWITPVQFVHHIRTQSRTALKGQRELYPNIGPSCPSLTPPRQSCCSRHISIHAGRAWLGDGCMHAASSRDVCLQLCWAPCSSRDLQKTFILHILQTDVPSPQGLRGVARKKWQ